MPARSRVHSSQTCQALRVECYLVVDLIHASIQIFEHFRVLFVRVAEGSDGVVQRVTICTQPSAALEN